MYSAVFCIIVLGALLGVAECDFKCFAEKLKNLDKDILKFFVDNSEKCRDAKKPFIDELQQSIDKCSVPVKTDSMSTLIDEACDPNSELSKAFKESEACMAQNQLNKAVDDMNCRPKSMPSYLSAKEGCLKLKRDFFTCSASAVGRRCGGRIENTMKRIYQTSDSLTNGLCDELASNSTFFTFGNVVWIAVGCGVLLFFLMICVKVFKKPKPASAPNRCTTAVV